MNKEEIIKELNVIYKNEQKISLNIIKKYASFSIRAMYKAGLHMKDVKKIVGYTEDKAKKNKILNIKELIKASLLEEYNKQKFIDVKKYQKEHRGMTSQIWKVYGGFWRALKDAGIRQKMTINKMTEEECIEELSFLYKKYGKITKDIIEQHSITSYSNIRRIYGGLQKINKYFKTNLKSYHKYNTSKEELNKEVYRLVKKNGYISKPMMEKESCINPKVVSRIYGSFSKMYEQLNIPYNKSGRKPTDQELIDDFVLIYKKHKYINKEILNQESKFSTTCYHDRFGSINKLKEKLGIEQSSCGPKSSSQTADWCIAKFEKVIGQKAQKEKTFNWLVNPKTNRKLRLDGYFSKIKTGIEYNGPQHYKFYKRYYKTKSDLEYRQYLDQLKISLCKKHGIKIITIKYTDKISDDFIKQKLSN